MSKFLFVVLLNFVVEKSVGVALANYEETFVMDGLGRRIRMIDKTERPDVTTLYYYNPEWQVLIEFDESDWLRYYVYGKVSILNA